MKKKSLISIVAAVFVFLFFASSVLFAEERKIELNKTDGIKEILTVNIGKRVSVKTDSGEAIEGTVEKVGDYLVHISKLSGKDLYDAVVRIEKINSVVLRVRGN